MEPFVAEIKFDEESKSIPFRCWYKEGFLHVALAIEGGGTCSQRVDPEKARSRVEAGLEFIMDKEQERIKEYLKRE